MSGRRPGPAGRPVRAALAALVALAVVLGAAACADDGADGATSATTTAEGGASALLPPLTGGQELPPDDFNAIRQVYEPALPALGVRLTRAGS